MNEEVKIIETDSIDIYQSEEKAAIDIQIATAKQYPRDIRRAKDNSIAIATMDKLTAESCNYSLPRAGKKISGPSVHLARIIAQEWGNLRVESKVVNITSNQIVSQAVCFDLEKNYAVKVEVRKKITGRDGNRYNEDMIVTTGNAASAIAYRNAVFSVIPKAVTENVYIAAKNMITGDLSSEQALIKKRKGMIDGFKENYDVDESQILEVLGLNSINQIKQPEIVTLIGIVQAIKDGDTSIHDTFGATKKAEKTKTDKKVSKINDKLKDVKAKKAAEKAEAEQNLEEIKFPSEDAARKTFTKDFGVLPENLKGDKLFSTAKELGFNLQITDGKLL